MLIMLLAMVLGLDAKTWEAEDIPMVHLTDARRYVCDPDEILSQAERDSIDSYLLRLDKQCGVESVFVIVKRVSNGDTFRFAQDLGNRQGVGKQEDQPRTGGGRSRGGPPILHRSGRGPGERPDRHRV